MEESFSDSVYKRLPSNIQKLDRIYQNIFIYVRLRKSDGDISRLLRVSLDDARSKIKKVKEELINAGLADLIETPSFVPINPAPGIKELQFPANEPSSENRLILKEFLLIFKGIVNKLPPYQSRLLRLRYNNQMSAREIIEFSIRLNVSLIPDKEIPEVREQDIFYGLNVALKSVLKELGERYRGANVPDMDGLKYIFEEIEI